MSRTGARCLRGRCAASQRCLTTVLRGKAPAGTQLLDELLARIQIEVAPVDAELAEEAITGWHRFGKGRHRAGLNFGDTFSYALSRRLGQPLLFAGSDFAHTDVDVF